MTRQLGVQESYTDPTVVYRNAKARGATHVTITDRDTIDGALRLADRDDFLVGEEVTSFFPAESLNVDALVWGIDERQHAEIHELRFNLFDLVHYLQAEGIPYGLAHPCSFRGGRLTPRHFELMLLLFPLWETRNGHADPLENALAQRLIDTTPERLVELAEKNGVAGPSTVPRGFGGSDDRSGLDVGATFTEVDSDGMDVLQAIASGEIQALGEEGSTIKMAHTGSSLFLGSALSGTGARLSGHVLKRLGQSSTAWSVLARPRSQRLAGRALTLATGRPGKRRGATSWQWATLQQAAAALARGDLIDPAQRHERLAAMFEAAWQHTTSENLQRIRDAAGEARAWPTAELKALTQAQVLVAPYLSAAAYRARERRHVRSVETTLASGGLLPAPAARPAPRVAMFTDTYSEINGVATVLRALTAHSVASGWPFTLVNCGSERASEACREIFPAIETLSLDVYKEFPLRIGPVLELLRWCEDEQVGVIHAATPGPVGMEAVLLARSLGLPLVGTYHTDLPRLGYFLTRDHMAEELLWSYIRWFFGQCRVVFCPSRLAQSDLSEHGVRTTFAPFDQGVDVGFYSPTRRHEHLRRELGGGGKVILWVGRVSAEKGLDLLASAYNELRTQRRDARLVVVGDGPYRERFAAQVPDATFLGYRTGAELAAIYASADIFVFPGLAETFGQVVLEAAASGLPAVVSAGVAVDELVEHERSALMVAPGDARGFAAAIGRLLDDRDLRERLGRGARQTAMGRGWPAAFGRLWSVYESLVT
jgi:glycosyltransferase involved in cell wall biosynthesis